MATQASGLDIQVGSISQIGGRSNNEDAVLVDRLPAPAGAEAPWLLAVADGMGGHDNGEMASNLAIQTLRETLVASTADDLALTLKQAYRAANNAIYARGSGDQSTPGTTLVAAVVNDKYATIANVGDSRAYLLRAGQLNQITQDHSVVAEQIAAGTLTEDEARNSPQRNYLTAALGLNEQLARRLPDIYDITLLPEDRLLLCTDGFFDVLQKEDYLQELSADNAQQAAEGLTSLAIARSTTDNVSAVVLMVGSSLATRQRLELSREIASQQPETGTSILVPVLILIVLAIVVAAGIWYLM